MELTQEQLSYTEAVKRNTDGMDHISVGFCPSCAQCSDEKGFCCLHSAQAAYDAGKVTDEGSFSWSNCEGCGSTFGGDRFAAHGWANINGKITLLHFEVCVDCLQFIANGELPEQWTQHPQ